MIKRKISTPRSTLTIFYQPKSEQRQSYMDEVRTTIDVHLQVLCRPHLRLSLLLGSHFDGRASLGVTLAQDQAFNVAVHQPDSPGGGSLLLLRSRNSLDVFKLPRPPEGCGGGGEQRCRKVPPPTKSKRALLETGQQEYKKSTQTASKRWTPSWSSEATGPPKTSGRRKEEEVLLPNQATLPHSSWNGRTKMQPENSKGSTPRWPQWCLCWCWGRQQTPRRDGRAPTIQSRGRRSCHAWMLVARHNFLDTLTSWKQCKCEEEASPGETSPTGTLSTSILLEPEAAPVSTTLAEELNISTRPILVFLGASESSLKRLLFKARASRRAACSFFLLMMLSIFTAAQFSYVLLLPRCLSDWTLSWKRRRCIASIFAKDCVCISHD